MSDFDKAVKGLTDAAKRSGSGMIAEANVEETVWLLKMRDAVNEMFRDGPKDD